MTYEIIVGAIGVLILVALLWIVVGVWNLLRAVNHLKSDLFEWTYSHDPEDGR